MQSENCEFEFRIEKVKTKALRTVEEIQSDREQMDVSFPIQKK